MRVRCAVSVLALVVASAGCSRDETSSTTPSDATTAPAATTAAPSDSTAPATTTTTPPPDTTSPGTTPPDTTAPSTTTTTPPPDTTSPPTTTTTPPAVRDVRVYFLRGERLAIAHRDVAGPAVLRAALTELLAGPNQAERSTAVGSLTTVIPAGTALLDLNLADGLATVDLSDEFDDGGGSLSMRARVAQVVFTATAFDNVDRVRFWMEGEPIDYLGGEGIEMGEPWTRAMVDREISGSVIVDVPAPGSIVTSPFVVTGEGDVYEGDFPIEIRRDGDVLTVIAPVTAGAWGDWRDFGVTVAVEAPPGPIELVAYDEGGCGDAPECPPVIETVVPLVLAR